MEFKIVHNNLIKIGIIGSKKVGKTSLANLLNGQLKTLGVSCDLVHESARYCPLPLNKNTSIDSAYWLFGSQIAAEALVSANKQVAICDRTVLDLYPFVQYSLTDEQKRRNEEFDNSIKLHPLKILINDYILARPYTFLFYVPIRPEAWETYSQPDDIAFQKAIDDRLREFLEDLKVDYYELKMLSSFERIEEILAYIQNKQVLF